MFQPFSIRAEGNLSYPAVEEKMSILEKDLRSYATIVEQEAPAFAAEHDMIHLLKYETVILSDPDECRTPGILTEEAMEETPENAAGETGKQKFITGCKVW